MTTRLRGAAPGSARCAVVLLHGRDQDPDWITEHVVDRVADPDVAWIVPAAPGGTWYPGRYTDPLDANQPYLDDALATIDRCTATAEAAVGRERTVLAGFSQGACLCTEYALRHPARYGGLLLFTGARIGPPGTGRTTTGRADSGRTTTGRTTTGRTGGFAGTPAFLGTGSHDEWVAVEHVRTAAALLEQRGARVELRVYPGRPHEICDDEIERARALLSAVGGDVRPSR